MPRLACWAAVALVAAPGKWEANARAAASSLATDTLASLVSENKVVIFSRGRSTATARVMHYFEELGIPYYALELDQREDGAALQKALAAHTSAAFPPGHHEYPAIFIRGEHIQGGTYKIGQAFKSGELEHWVHNDDDDSAEGPRAAEDGLVEVVVRTVQST